MTRSERLSIMSTLYDLKQDIEAYSSLGVKLAYTNKQVETILMENIGAW